MSDSRRGASAPQFRRREALIGLGGLGVAGAIWEATRGSSATRRVVTETPRASSAAACILSPEVTEGPYWIPNHLTRRDITEGRPGLPLALHITVVAANTCTAIPNADVEVWHADATGTYSGFAGNSPPFGGPGGSVTPNNTQGFLRGHQRSDAEGRVLFETIYPGWYPGRAPHIHLKVHLRGSVVHTGQLFFADRISDAVYHTGAYEPHGQPDTTNTADMIYDQAGASRAQLHLRKRNGHPGYSGQITVGVAT